MLENKLALVTGASGGIGSAICRELAKEKCNLAMVYHGNQNAAEALAEELSQEYGIAAKAYRCEVSDFDDVKRTVSAIKKEMGNIQVLVNNAGITKDNLILMMKEADYDSVLDTNLKGAFNMIRHVAPVMLRGKEGHIINVSSVVGLMGNPGQTNYSASKAGLIGLTKSVAKELASKNIVCNAVAPGFIRTKMTEQISDKEAVLLSMIPQGRIGEPKEVAKAVAFLADASYITGEVLRVDGGIAC